MNRTAFVAVIVALGSFACVQHTTTRAYPKPPSEPYEPPRSIMSPVPQEAAPRGPIRIREERDEFGGDTELTVVLEGVPESSAHGDFVRVVFRWTSDISDLLLMMFSQESERWRYLECHNVFTNVDRATGVAMERVEHNGSVMNRGGVLEHVSMPITLRELESFSLAHEEFAIRVCNTVVRFEDREIDVLKRLFSRISELRNGTVTAEM